MDGRIFNKTKLQVVSSVFIRLRYDYDIEGRLLTTVGTFASAASWLKWEFRQFAWAAAAGACSASRWHTTTANYWTTFCAVQTR